MGSSGSSGTTITFQPDAEIFETLTFSYDVLATRFREMSFLNSGLTIYLEDERDPSEGGTKKKDTFFSEGGLVEFVQYVDCLLYTSPSPRDQRGSRMPSSA